MSWISGRGAETPRALRPKEQSIKRKPHGHEFSKEFQNDLHPKKRKKRKPEDLVTADLPCNKRQAQRSACPFRTSWTPQPCSSGSVNCLKHVYLVSWLWDPPQNGHTASSLLPDSRSSSLAPVFSSLYCWSVSSREATRQQLSPGGGGVHLCGPLRDLPQGHGWGTFQATSDSYCSIWHSPSPYQRLVPYEGRRFFLFFEGDNRGWDGWMASPTQWTWVWVNSRSWWWTGKLGVLQSMGSQRVGHDWTTEWRMKAGPYRASAYLPAMAHTWQQGGPLCGNGTGCPAISLPSPSSPAAQPASPSLDLSTEDAGPLLSHR